MNLTNNVHYRIQFAFTSSCPRHSDIALSLIAPARAMLSITAGKLHLETYF